MTHRGLIFLAVVAGYLALFFTAAPSTDNPVRFFAILGGGLVLSCVIVDVALARAWPPESVAPSRDTPPLPARTLVRTERHRRSLWGKMCLVLFVAFNAFCAWDVFTLSQRIDSARRSASGLGHLTVAAIGNQRMNQLLAVWLAGAVVLGLLAWLTRGRLEVTERIVDDPATPTRR